MKFSSFLCAFGILVFISSCRKNDSTGNPPGTGTSINDSVLAISRDVYLWNTQIPATFDASKYAGPSEVMTAIREFSSEPGFAQPVDHFSFAMKKTEWDNLSAGIASDFGMDAFFFTDNDLRVRNVAESSPAALAGIHRGWKFVTVAGLSDFTTDNSDFLIDNIYQSPSTTFTFEKPDGSTTDITLNAGTYQENPVILDTVYNEGSRKAGYLVFNSFLGDTSAVNSELQQIFSRFVNEGVTDVIVDLRYNGGGYVSMQENLANYLVKPSAEGSIMMSQVYNDNYSDLNETTRFHKRGSLNVNNVYFIVTDNTASASELLINNLKPYMNVKLVGPESTYGKPVGFFPIGVSDWYVFPVSFRSTNGEGSGNYFNGIEVDKEVDDGLNKDWGDTNESALNTVLGHISTGSFGTSPLVPALNSVIQSNIREGNKELNRGFRGAVIAK